jgi:hypothetical protein
MRKRRAAPKFSHPPRGAWREATGLGALSGSQAKALVDSLQTYAALSDVRQKLQPYSGGMHWKTVAGSEYLYRTLDGKGNAKSLGRARLLPSKPWLIS